MNYCHVFPVGKEDATFAKKKMYIIINKLFEIYLFEICS